MALKPFDKNLLKLLYSLTKNQDFMNSAEVARNFTDSRASERTIRRWFRYLEKTCFDYYPYIRHESFGLVPHYVLLKNLKNEGLLQIIPHMDYITYGFDFNSVKGSFLVKYQVPLDNVTDFWNFFREAKVLDIIDDYQIFKIRSPTEFYSPFHQVLDKEGNPDFSKSNNFDNNYFMDILQKNLNSKPDVSVNEKIKDNPFIVPTVFEFFREHWTSKEVWASMKKKLGQNIWRYAKKVKKQTDGAGRNLVQKTMKDLYGKDKDTFFQQIRVFYDPFLKRMVSFFLFLESNKVREIPNLSEKLSRYCLKLIIYPPSSRENKFLFFLITGSKEISTIIKEVREFDPKARVNVLWRDLEKSSMYWNRNYLKMNYSLFDPVSLDWTYDSNTYSELLENLAGRKITFVKPKAETTATASSQLP